MNKPALLVLMLPLAACMTPEQIAQRKAEETAAREWVDRVKSTCASRGLSSHTQAYVWCVNTELRREGIEIAREDTARLGLRDSQSGSFTYSESSAGARPSGSEPTHAVGGR
jgi:hypothetical protein